MLAPPQGWEVEFPAKNGRRHEDGRQHAHSRLQAQAEVRAHNTRRGPGAWFDGETPIFHAGDRLIVGGENKAIAEHSSRFV